METQSQYKYAVYYPGCCDEHGGPEMEWYETLEEAEKSCSVAEYIFEIIKEPK